MTILEAFREVTESVSTWVEQKFLKKDSIDSFLSSNSKNPVQNKVVNNAIESLNSAINNIDVSDKVLEAIREIDYLVYSVNGKAGAVILSASDVGALPADTYIPSINGLATETYVNERVANLVNSAPTTLDTLNELAAALGDDPNFATTIATQIGELKEDINSISTSSAKLTTITIPAANWTGSYSPYSQVVSVNSVGVNSKLDLQPTPYQIVELQESEISLMTSNNNGIVTVYAIGGKPASDMEMQVLITEVSVV